MKLLHKLSWFFRLEKKHYLIGILSLILVSFFNLIPPRIMGVVIDRIDKKKTVDGAIGSGYFAFGSCGPCYVCSSFYLAALYFWDS